jgi:hypothetical protein
VSVREEEGVRRRLVEEGCLRRGEVVYKRAGWWFGGRRLGPGVDCTVVAKEGQRKEVRGGVTCTYAVETNWPILFFLLLLYVKILSVKTFSRNDTTEDEPYTR